MPEHLVAVTRGGNWAQAVCWTCDGPAWVLRVGQRAATLAGVDASRHAAEMSEQQAPASAGGAEGGR